MVGQHFNRLKEINANRNELVAAELSSRLALFSIGRGQGVTQIEPVNEPKLCGTSRTYEATKPSACLSA